MCYVLGQNTSLHPGVEIPGKPDKLVGGGGGG